MAIVENKATELGDVIIIQAEVPIVGLVALTDFIDSTTGEDANKFFTKEFRYTLDGVNYTNWQPLNTINLQNVDVTPTDTFIIEYRYTRSGTDGTGELTYEDSNLLGNFEDKSCGISYNKSIFSQFFSCDDTEVLSWCINVTEKLYKRGIVPKFIERGELGNQDRIDQDYLDFWRSVACFFAYHVIYARKLVDFGSNIDTLRDFIKQRGVYFCQNQDIQELNDILNNQFRERSRRGTKQIYKTNSEGYEGELLRLLCYQRDVDEFIFNLTNNNNLGEWGDESSDEYNGTLFQSGLIKAYEPLEGFREISKYPLINQGAVSIINEELKVTPNGTESGIGDPNYLFPIIINPSIGYEVTAYVKVSNTSLTISMGAFTTDEFNNPLSIENINNAADEDFFFQGEQLLIADKYYLIRGIIYPYTKSLLSNNESELNVGFGVNKRFKVTNRRIFPRLVFNGTGTATVQDFKIKPVSTPYSTGGYIQTQNFISMWATNRNGEFSENESFNIIRKYLIPYNSTLQPIWLEKAEELE